jgi:hypothetical protein
MDIQAQHARTIFPITLLLRAQIILHSSLPELLHITEELPRQLLVLLGFFLHFELEVSIGSPPQQDKRCLTLTWSNRCHYVAKKISSHEKAKNGLKILRLPTVSCLF